MSVPIPVVHGQDDRFDPVLIVDTGIEGAMVAVERVAVPRPALEDKDSFGGTFYQDLGHEAGLDLPTGFAGAMLLAFYSVGVTWLIARFWGDAS